MYALEKFPPRILNAYEGTTLRSSNKNRKIDLYSKYTENKLQVVPKMDVTYE